MNAFQSQVQPTLSPRFITYVRDYCMDRGIDPSRLFARCGVDIQSCDEFDRAVPASQVALLFEEAAKDSGNPSLGLDMARSYHYEASSLLILAVVSAPNVAEGIRCLCHYDRFVDTAIDTRFEADEKQAEFSHCIMVPEGVITRQLAEYLSAFLVQALSNSTRQRMPIKEVRFKHAHADNQTILEQFFSAPVLFGQQENLIVFDSSYLQERFYSSHSLLHDVLIQALKTYFVSSESGLRFFDILCRELIRDVGDEAVTLESVAQRMAMSPRTLRRRLSEEGQSFQEVKKLAREKRAKYYLSHTNMPLAEIAFELGYSELSAFSRAFRNWAGVNPQTYRQHTTSRLAN